VISPVTQDDLDFVYSSWLNSYAQTYYSKRPDGSVVRRTPMPKPHFFAAQQLLIDALLKRSLCLVYRSPVDASVIRGYAVAEKRGDGMVLHWAYTRSNRRREGVMRALLAELSQRLGTGVGGVYTHMRNPGCAYLDAMGFVFGPQELTVSK